MRSQTSTGYMSDIGGDRVSRAQKFVEDHRGGAAAEEMHRKYDTAGVVLGRGACGSVVAVRHKQSGEMYAMKVVNLDAVGGTIEEIKKELEIQRMLDHPNICKIYESYLDEDAGEMAIIMEMCTGGALVKRVTKLRTGYGERAAATLVEKMLSAVIYCHHHGVVHRDIKLDNFIYESEAEDSELKLIDFGFACELTPGQEVMWDKLGSPSYMAPELYDKGVDYDSSVDMWALGVVTYMLLSGKRPFHHQDPRVKARMIACDALRFPSPEWDGVSGDAMEFCRSLMQKAPRDRLAATQAREHSWIQNASQLHAPEKAARFAKKFQSTSVIDSLNAFCEADDLKKLALEAMAFSTPPTKLKELREMFVKIDTDDSGTLSLDEFKAAMELHPMVPPHRVEQIFATMDPDGSGEVDYSMFVSAMLGRRRSMVSNTNSIMVAFATLDADGDGFITQADLDKLLDKSPLAHSEDVLDLLRPDHGFADEQGRVAFADFQRMMLRGLRNGSVIGASARNSRASISDLSEKSGGGAGAAAAAEEDVAAKITSALQKGVFQQPDLVALGALDGKRDGDPADDLDGAVDHLEQHGEQQDDEAASEAANNHIKLGRLEA